MRMDVSFLQLSESNDTIQGMPPLPTSLNACLVPDVLIYESIQELTTSLTSPL